MKKLKYFLYILVCAFALISCGGKSNVGSDEFLIEGRFLHSRGNPIYIDVIHSDNIEKIDSLKLDENGNFSFRHKADQALFLKISIDEENFITLIAEPGQSIILSGDVKALAETYTVSGSEASELIYKHNSFTRKQYNKLDTIFNIWEENKYAENKLALRDSIDSLVTVIKNEQTEYVKNIINSNPNSLASLFIIYQKFGRQLVLDENENFDTYAKLAESLSKKYPRNEHVNHLNARVNKIKIAKKEETEIKKRLEIGKEIPNFTLDDINNNPFSLNEHRNSVILLHFWGSWSQESMRQISTLKNFYKTYAPKGFKIVSVSFDFDEETWKSAVEKEKMTWYNVCDFKYNTSPIARQYCVQEIPFMYLIDKNGIISCKSNSTDSIGQKIYELYH